MASHHLVTVCMFCLLCASHSSCSAHVEMSQSGMKRVQDLQHERFKSSDSLNTMNNIDSEFKHGKLKSELDSEIFNRDNIKESYSNKHSVILHKSETVSLNEPQKIISNNRDGDVVNTSDAFDTIPQDKRIIKHRRKRNPHLSNEKSKHASESSESDDGQLKGALKNIDVDFYIKKIFTEFGDRDSMTMNLAGFERMLRKLDLDRMIVAASQTNSPIESVVNGVRSNSTNVTCVNSLDLINSLNAQQKSSHHHSNNQKASENVQTVVNQSNATINNTLEALKHNVHFNTKAFIKVCPILLYQKVAQTSYERHGCIVEQEFPKVIENSLYHDHDHMSKQSNSHHDEEISYDVNRTGVWLYSSLSILVISACGIFGVLVIPIMHHNYYQQILQFLVALAVGTLCGDATLHLLPHAMSGGAHDHGHSHEFDVHSHNDSMWKGLAAVLGIVFFYFTEKGLILVSECRKRKIRLDKENKLPPRVRVMRNDSSGCIKKTGGSHSKACGFIKMPSSALSMFKPNSKNPKPPPENKNMDSGKICKHKYSEYPYCYDEIATETHDDHHVRDGWTPSNGAPGETKVQLNNLEPTCNDTLLNKVIEEYSISNNKPIDSSNPVLTTEIDEKTSEQKPDGDVHDDLILKISESEENKNSNDRESYTVILREHSQTHHGHSHSHGHVHSPPSSISSVAWMVIMGDGLHNFTDGMAIGAAFSNNIAGGFSTAVAVLCHELPHEIGDFAVLLKAGMSAKRAIFYNVLSSVLCLFGMILGVLVGHAPDATAWVFAIAAGMFLYIALVDMIPELTSSHSNEGSLCQYLIQFAGFTIGIGIMTLIAMYEHELMQLFG